jgi:hypothetical protein
MQTVARSGYMQRWGILGVTMRFYYDFNVLIECDEEAQKALNRKLPELAAEHHADIGLADAK